VEDEDAGLAADQRQRVLGIEQEVDLLAAHRERHRDLVPGQLGRRVDHELAQVRVGPEGADLLGLAIEEHELVPAGEPEHLGQHPPRVDVHAAAVLAQVAEHHAYAHGRAPLVGRVCLWVTLGSFERAGGAGRPSPATLLNRPEDHRSPAG
jgi:hypothetical protein